MTQLTELMMIRLLAAILEQLDAPDARGNRSYEELISDAREMIVRSAEYPR